MSSANFVNGLLGSAVLWSVVSWAWALDPWTAAKASGKLAFFAALGLSGLVLAGNLAAATRRRMGQALFAGVVAALIFLAVEIAAGGAISRLLYDMNSPAFERFRMSRGITVLALCAGPAVFWLWQKERTWAAALLALGCFLLFRQMDNLSATYGFPGSCLLFLVIRWRPPWAAWDDRRALPGWRRRHAFSGAQYAAVDRTRSTDIPLLVPL